MLKSTIVDIDGTRPAGRLSFAQIVSRALHVVSGSAAQGRQDDYRVETEERATPERKRVWVLVASSVTVC